MSGTMQYGPQTAEVEALLARVRTLTDAEVLALHTAYREMLSARWDVARYAAWDAAYRGERDVIRLEVRIAVWEARPRPIWHRRWEAAKEAALALVARDLITPDGFTQEQYDLLTGPWRRVIGKVHPDDAELTETESPA